MTELQRAVSFVTRSRSVLLVLALAVTRPVHAQANRAAESSQPIVAQASSPAALRDTTRTFLTRHDLVYGGIAVAATAITSAFDPNIARWALKPSVQGSSGRHRVIQDLSNVTGETWLTWGTVATYAIGRLGHSDGVADVSLHLIEGQAVTAVAGQLVRGVLGRQRPSVDPNTQYSFHWGKGFTQFNYRAFPSLHSAAGFIVASGLLEEMRERNSSALPWATPLLYAFALVPGVTRMYLGQHWASDVIAGAFLGQFVGTRVVHYAHTHQRNKLDRILLGVTVMPTGDGGAAVGFSLAP